MKERIEMFDPEKLSTDPSWKLDYGVPDATVTYFLDTSYKESEDDNIGLEDAGFVHAIAGFVHAIDRVEELTRTEGSTAFVVRRPMGPVGPDLEGFEYAVFRPVFPKVESHPLKPAICYPEIFGQNHLSNLIVWK